MLVDKDLKAAEGKFCTWSKKHMEPHMDELTRKPSLGLEGNPGNLLSMTSRTDYAPKVFPSFENERRLTRGFAKE
ncbi:hypothetical protein KPH14_002035 [Odynerus spinipes]|uniref:Uncharacterized protein n=1 Tax=Odynerus spinipes TaxID=1348599 RepID=A0AAD9VW68_9HYME|nr:hypothetical protein KPH14_002035 [Odynerus spinipes]